MLTGVWNGAAIDISVEAWGGVLINMLTNIVIGTGIDMLVVLEIIVVVVVAFVVTALGFVVAVSCAVDALVDVRVNAVYTGAEFVIVPSNAVGMLVDLDAAVMIGLKCIFLAL